MGIPTNNQIAAHCMHFPANTKLLFLIFALYHITFALDSDSHEPDTSMLRSVARIVTAHKQREGGGFIVRRAVRGGGGPGPSPQGLRNSHVHAQWRVPPPRLC